MNLLREGVQDYLTKPFLLGELLARVGGIMTRRRQAEAVRQSEEKFHGLYDSIMDGVVHRTMTGAFVESNSAYRGMLGYSSEELAQRDRVDLTPARWHKLEAAIMANQVLARGYSDEYEAEYVRKNGTVFPVAVREWLIKDADGQPLGVWAIVRDMTERKRAEEAITRLNAELHSHVSQLEDANRELDAFSYSVSHDLRAPLRAVDGYARVLKEDYGELLDAEGHRVLGVVRSEARRMGELIDELLAFSRLGRQPMALADTDMTELARETFESLAGQATDRVVDFKLGDLPRAAVDTALFRQVWANLLENAIKYTRGRRPACIEVGGAVERGEMVYFVKDNGAGFDMRYADKLFGVFQRLHRQDEFEGTGVGLALVQRIVHRHGGRVWAQGKVDDGATLHFALPIQRESTV